LAARYWKKVYKQSLDAEEKAKCLSRIATYHFSLLDKANGNKYVHLAQQAWTDLSSKLKGITLSSIEPMSEEFIDDVVSLEDGIPDFPERPFEVHVHRTENHRRWVESWVVKYKPERVQLCFIAGVKSPVAYSWIEPKSRKEVEVHSLVVRKAFRRKGLATDFLSQLFRKFKEAEYDNILLGVLKRNLAAIRLYQRLGFEITKEDDLFYDMKLPLDKRM